MRFTYTLPRRAAHLFPTLVISSVLHAQVVCVDDGNQSQTQNGSPQYPYRTIQGALMGASALDTIKVAAGGYGRIDNLGGSFMVLGGYPGGTPQAYEAGAGGDFSTAPQDPSLTVISGGPDSIGVNLTRFDFAPFSFTLQNLTVRNSRKGIVFDQELSWPHVANVTITGCIIEDNGQPGVTTLGAGVLVSGQGHRLIGNVIRGNRGGRGAGICGNLDVGDSILVEGNRVENNTGYDDHCAGIYLGGYAVLRNNVIRGNQLQNSYGWGGGLLILGTAFTSGNIFSENYCPSYGGAVFVDEGGVLNMRNDLVHGNSTGLQGGAIAADYGDPGSSYVYITNCTIANNHSPGGGNAVLVDGSSFATVTNSILHGNGDDFLVTPGSAITVSYTLSEETAPGTGNFTADPLFADTANADFHLRSTAGRYDPFTQQWVSDVEHSPAIDAGDPASTYENEPGPNGGRINLGFDGNTPQASLSAPMGLPDHAVSEVLITAWPVPARDELMITLPLSAGTGNTLRIYDGHGRRVLERAMGRSMVLTELSHFSAGEYVLHITTKDGASYTRPIVLDP